MSSPRPFTPPCDSAIPRSGSMSLAERSTPKINLATAEDYIAWVEELYIYRGYIGLTSWESRAEDIVALTSVSDSPDAELGQNDLDLNGCLNNAVKAAKREKWLDKEIFSHRHLALGAMAVLDKRIDEEISDPAVVKSLKRAGVKLSDKIIGLSKVGMAPPEYTVHLSATYPKDQKLSCMTHMLRSFRIPFTASFGEFAAKLNSESLAFGPEGRGVNSGYSLEDRAWLYCILSTGHGVVSKCKRIARNADYLAFVRSLSPGLVDKVAIWHETSPPPSKSKSTKMAVTSPVIETRVTSHANPPLGITAEEHAWLVSNHPVDIIDYAIELKDRGTRAFQSGNPTLGLKEYKRGLTSMSYLTKDPPSTQKLCDQIRATLHLNCALMLLELHCFEETITSSSKALKVSGLTNQQMASAHYHRGMAYKGLQDKLKALEDLAAAFKLSPRDVAIVGMLDVVEQSLIYNRDPDVRQKYEKFKARTCFPNGAADKMSKSLKATTLTNALRMTPGGDKLHDYPPIYKSVLSVCEIQTTERSTLAPRKASGAVTKPDPRSETPAKGDLSLPADFWGDWTSDIDENGEPLDKYGKPFFEPYDPCGIVRAVLKDPSFP